MRVMRSDIREVLPAAGAFVMAGFRHDGGGFGDHFADEFPDGILSWGGWCSTAGDVEVAQDEEFVEGGGIAEDGMRETFGGKGQGDGGFEVGADLLFLAGFFDGLLDDAANFEEFFDGGGGFRSGEGGIRLREDLHVHTVAVAEVFPGFIGGEGEDGGEELAQGLGDLADGGLGGAAARAVGGVAVHPVLGDVDVEGAELGGEEAVHHGEDLAEVVGGVGGDALGGDGVEALQDPAVDECVL